eukprot:gene10913-2987_t
MASVPALNYCTTEQASSGTETSTSKDHVSVNHQLLKVSNFDAHPRSQFEAANMSYIKNPTAAVLRMEEQQKDIGYQAASYSIQSNGALHTSYYPSHNWHHAPGHFDASAFNKRSVHTTRRKRRNKIPRPMNSFMCFAKRYRQILQQENPGLDNKDISRMLGLKWRSLSEDERSIYTEQAKALAHEHRALYPEWKFTRETKKKKRHNDETGSFDIEHHMEDSPEDIADEVSVKFKPSTETSTNGDYYTTPLSYVSNDEGSRKEGDGVDRKQIEYSDKKPSQSDSIASSLTIQTTIASDNSNDKDLRSYFHDNDSLIHQQQLKAKEKISYSMDTQQEHPLTFQNQKSPSCSQAVNSSPEHSYSGGLYPSSSASSPSTYVPNHYQYFDGFHNEPKYASMPPTSAETRSTHRCSPNELTLEHSQGLHQKTFSMPHQLHQPEQFRQYMAPSPQVLQSQTLQTFATSPCEEESVHVDNRIQQQPGRTVPLTFESDGMTAHISNINTLGPPPSYCAPPSFQNAQRIISSRILYSTE